jgi:hypothetical protein
MKFNVVDQKSAKKALAYFNSFHDGFIKRIEINSHDYFDKDGQIMTGKFTIIIDFYHHNYQDNFNNYNKIIRVIFKDVSLFSLNTKEYKPHEWSICDMSINQEPNNKLKLAIDKRHILSFSEAIFDEI